MSSHSHRPCIMSSHYMHGASLWRWVCEESRADFLSTAVDSLGEVTYLVSDSILLLLRDA